MSPAGPKRSLFVSTGCCESTFGPHLHFTGRTEHRSIFSKTSPNRRRTCSGSFSWHDRNGLSISRSVKQKTGDSENTSEQNRDSEPRANRCAALPQFIKVTCRGKSI